MKTDVQIRNYLDGRMESGLLLIGSQYHKMSDDAMKVASTVLSCDASMLPDHPDFLKVSPEGKTLGVNEVVPVLQKAQLQPAVSDRQVVLIDGFDVMTVQAQNKLLKLIEESELLVIGIAKEDKVLPTIKSRMRVVTYSPLSLSEFEEVFDGEDILSSYFLTGGNPYAEPDKGLLSIFGKVRDAIEQGKEKDLFAILSLVKEKDNSNFFNQGRGAVSSLISMIGTLYAKKGDSRRVMLCKENKERCSLPSYTGTDFFLFVAEIGGIK